MTRLNGLVQQFVFGRPLGFLDEFRRQPAPNPQPASMSEMA